jgi:hypothetical protein
MEFLSEKKGKNHNNLATDFFKLRNSILEQIAQETHKVRKNGILGID